MTPANDNAAAYPAAVRWEMRRGDCLDLTEGVTTLGRGWADHVITDPPFSPYVQGRSMRGGRGKPEAREFRFEPVTPLILSMTAAQIAIAARRWVLVFSDVESVSAWREMLEGAGLEYVRTMAWVRPGSAPQFSGDRPAAGFDAIVVAHATGVKGGPIRKRWNGGGAAGVYTFPGVAKRGGARQHPAEKPIDLMRALVRDFTDHGEMIADPFAGTGTTGAAALNLGRRFIGWERDDRWYGIASRRLGLVREQLNLPLPARRARPKQQEIEACRTKTVP